ncbi:hypothetical protein PM03_01630 [Thalassobacter stenotrophicus]|jgi:hypothetical protein|uniref:DUF1150 family protein n=2 Tax=Thalassobacter stenotrophicus TaxID=266809 RepID=A0ABY1I084_9RHOB|nr:MULTISPECIES: DUF1150 family protein [Thalassobacter]KGK80657.1 hypothetical protein PM03_01630 [Thalassobacter stenotrophicus]KGL02039.1 hypothetical protein PM04_05655 [Thalassobacter sp. 16PALIMAR09]PVZ49081.1 DUF1150 domain-containing protein [Thalassobacter stenotrophicus]CUH61930.1 putative small protein [Thalassobacter stenotrophicus]SHI38768.1 hypothetical protein SAMN02744035_00389 [Thalassobacter stenotrophicus DSM 16310]
MTENFDIKAPEGDTPLVYVRPVEVADLPEAVRAEAGDVGTLYALHRPNGQQLALVRDRKLAFVLARQNDLTPVSVH